MLVLGSLGQPIRLGFAPLEAGFTTHIIAASARDGTLVFIQSFFSLENEFSSPFPKGRLLCREHREGRRKTGKRVMQRSWGQQIIYPSPGPSASSPTAIPLALLNPE
jgi:hypothetical protein